VGVCSVFVCTMARVYFGAVDGCRGACGRCEKLSKDTRRCERSVASPFEALGESATPKPKVESEAGGGTYVLINCGVGGVDGLRLGSRVEGKVSMGISRCGPSAVPRVALAVERATL